MSPKSFPFPGHIALATKPASPTTTTPSTISSPPSPPSPSPPPSLSATPPAKPHPTLSSLYTSLSHSQQTVLLQLTHFIHLHASALHLTAYDLLPPAEASLLSRTGKPYHALLSALSLSLSPAPAPTLEALLSHAESAATAANLRAAYQKPYPAGAGRQGPNPHDIRACARPVRVDDSRGDAYAWIRGPFGVSPRIARNGRLLVAPLRHAERLRVRGGRKDVFVSGWIVSRVESADRRRRAVEVEWEKMERERVVKEKERMERERIRKEKLERERVEREKLEIGVSRKRRLVCYAESDEESEEEGGDVDEFVCDEQVIDGSDADDDMEEEGEEEEEDEEEEGTRVVGRVRVCVSDRARRAERRARCTKDDESEEDDDDGDGVRRSKRLRKIYA